MAFEFLANHWPEIIEVRPNNLSTFVFTAAFILMSGGQGE